VAQAAITRARDERADERPARIARPRASSGERIVQATVGIVAAAALVLGVVLTPSPTGIGTHTHLGLPPCGMLVVTGHPCPTCGVTTSFVLAAHGRFWEALVNQPFGLVCFLLAVAGIISSTASLVMGCSWHPLLTVYGVVVPTAVLLVLALLSWAYKWSMM
jgi:hypothetical protein